MRNSFTFFLALSFTISAHAQIDPPIRLIHTTFLPGYVCDFRTFCSGRQGNRLFLIAEDHKTVEVRNIRTGGRIPQLPVWTAARHEVSPDPNSLIVDGGMKSPGGRTGKRYHVQDHQQIMLPTNIVEAYTLR